MHEGSWLKFPNLNFGLAQLVVLLLMWSCSQSSAPGVTKFAGNAQGTTYSVIYIGDEIVTQNQIDSTLKALDLSLSTYVKNSTISRVNTYWSGESPIDPHFNKVLRRSMEVYRLSNGAFNPMIKPLVDYWGFSGRKYLPPDSIATDTIVHLLELMRPTHVLLRDDAGKQANLYSITEFPEFTPSVVIKLDSLAQFDFNAIAQGYSVDVIANLLSTYGINNYMVELGGEVRASGFNADGNPWRIGVDKPNPGSEDRELQLVLGLKDKSVATSGNYRKFYDHQGVRYSHTIDPFTGFPVQHTPSILSATVITDDCMSADAFATVLMASTLESAIKFLERNSELEAYIIYAKPDGSWGEYMTPGFQKVVLP